MTDNTELLARLEEIMRSGDFAGMAALAVSHATSDFAQEWRASFAERMDTATA